MKDDTFILPVNRGSLPLRGAVDMQTTDDRLRITLSPGPLQQGGEVETKVTLHCLEVYVDDDLLSCLLLSRAVEPDSLEVTRGDGWVSLQLRVHEASGHPRPIRSAAEKGAEACVEHPRFQTSDTEAERGRAL